MSGASEQATPLDLHAQAEALDQGDALRHLRDQFLIPSIADINRKTLAKPKSLSKLGRRHCYNIEADHPQVPMRPNYRMSPSRAHIFAGTPLVYSQRGRQPASSNI